MQSAPEQDALWALAPLTATRGIVISGRGLLALELQAGTAVIAVITPMTAFAAGAGYAAAGVFDDRDLRDLGTGGQGASSDDALAQLTAFKDAMCACNGCGVRAARVGRDGGVVAGTGP